ncbi:PREDICTED: uncharacterized protein LOC106122793 isoform X1 [Papilio xuthus]|uniref:Uncharacterized protein LOC106122793 isoform X1 n=1 Tax=Papilio xuthus TaxID=66420 RepID=A0AAJ6ZKA8_PAPXU|nr:PREDICTED: uncharacterized protein LOC106122793 isoform X1 [Papilio xuthus]
MDDQNESSWFSSSFRCLDFGDIVGIMTTIIHDDGPMPMRDRIPTERIKNAADKFKESHQPDYEDRFMKNGDGIERVHNHNTAYPKLRDELDKRRSITKVAMPNLPNKRDGTHNMFNTGTRGKELKRKRSKIKRKYERKPKIKIDKAKTKTIIKPKCNHRKSNVRNLKCICQILKARNKKDTENSKRPKKVVNKKYQSLDMDLDIEPNMFLKKDKKPNSKEDLGSKDPDTSDASISTFASFPSTNHEPQI